MEKIKIYRDKYMKHISNEMNIFSEKIHERKLNKQITFLISKYKH